MTKKEVPLLEGTSYILEDFFLRNTTPATSPSAEKKSEREVFEERVTILFVPASMLSTLKI